MVTKKTVLIFCVLSVIHLIISTLYYHNVDWTIGWHTIVEITRGKNLYLQEIVFFEELEAFHGPPEQFPIYYYTLAIIVMIFGTEEIIGRIFLWIFTNILAFLVIKLANPETENQLQLIIGLYFLNPILLGISYLGFYDQFICVLMLTGIILLKHERSILAGIAFGLSSMTKIFPIFAIVTGIIYLFKQRTFSQIIKLMISSGTTILIICLYFILETGGIFFKKTIIYQFRREGVYEWNLSIWNYSFFRELQSDIFFFIQLILLVSSILYLILFYHCKNPSLSLTLSTASIISVFVFLLRTVYPHYGFWFITLSIPVMITFVKEKDLKNIIIVILPICLISIGTIIGYFIYLVNGVQIIEYQIIGSIIVNLGLIIQISHIFIIKGTHEVDGTSEGIR
ncbi:MAG: glycosyltransferase family 87 protein [Candidatus Hodarchaeales archaeon]|jgi:uncharacterized membrane protein